MEGAQERAVLLTTPHKKSAFFVAPCVEVPVEFGIHSLQFGLSGLGLRAQEDGCCVAAISMPTVGRGYSSFVNTLSMGCLSSRGSEHEPQEHASYSLNS